MRDANAQGVNVPIIAGGCVPQELRRAKCGFLNVTKKGMRVLKEYISVTIVN